MVEFALMAPLAFLLLFGIIVLGIVVTNQVQLTNIARDGARVAAVCGSSTTALMPDGVTKCSDAAVKAYITGHLQTVAAGAVSPSIEIFSGSTPVGNSIANCQPGRLVQVDASYNQPLYLPLVGKFFDTTGNNERTLTAQAQAACEQ